MQRFCWKDFLLILLGFHINPFLANVTISYAMNFSYHKIKGFLVVILWGYWEQMGTFASNRLKTCNKLCLNISHSWNFTANFERIYRFHSFIHSFIHSFFIYSHKTEVNIYMLTCSEAVPQRWSHKTGALKNARQTRGRIPMQEYDFNGTASQLH